MYKKIPIMYFHQNCTVFEKPLKNSKICFKLLSPVLNISTNYADNNNNKNDICGLYYSVRIFTFVENKTTQRSFLCFIYLTVIPES